MHENASGIGHVAHDDSECSFNSDVTIRYSQLTRVLNSRVNVILICQRISVNKQIYCSAQTHPIQCLCASFFCYFEYYSSPNNFSCWLCFVSEFKLLVRERVSIFDQHPKIRLSSQHSFQTIFSDFQLPIKNQFRSAGYWVSAKHNFIAFSVSKWTQLLTQFQNRQLKSYNLSCQLNNFLSIWMANAKIAQLHNSNFQLTKSHHLIKRISRFEFSNFGLASFIGFECFEMWPVRVANRVNFIVESPFLSFEFYMQ